MKREITISGINFSKVAVFVMAIIGWRSGSIDPLIALMILTYLINVRITFR